MRNYSIQSVMRMGQNTIVNRGRELKYDPFPGKYPTRLLITLKIAINGKWKQLFSYNGKYNYYQIRRIIRLDRDYRQKGIQADVSVLEYTQNTIISWGSLREGRLYPHHKYAYFRSPIRHNEHWAVLFSSEKYVPVRVGVESMMVLADTIPKLGDLVGLETLRKDIRQYRNKQERL